VRRSYQGYKNETPKNNLTIDYSADRLCKPRCQHP
jgi:hypothetical protein